MSWREVLGAVETTELPYTQNPQNTQKHLERSNFADIADSALGDSNLLKTIGIAVEDLPITAKEVWDALAPEDIEEWKRGEISIDTLRAFAGAIVERREMARGMVPTNYTERATCEQCGPVWLWFSGTVLGCPWCFNRLAGRPIP